MASSEGGSKVPAVIGAVVVAGVALAIALMRSGGDDPKPDATAPPVTRPAPAADVDSGVVVPELARQPIDAGAGSGADDGGPSTPPTGAEKPPPPPGTPEALVGLGVRDMGDDDREQAKLPAKVTGVLVTEVDPRSSAAESRLVPGDVIAEAHTTRLTGVDDLKRVVDGRDHTLIKVYRDGKPFQVVLHPPFKPRD